MKTKRFLSVILAVALVIGSLAALSACQDEKETSLMDAAKSELETYYNELLSLSYYSEDNAASLKAAYDDGVAKIEANGSAESFETEISDAKTAMKAIADTVCASSYTLNDYTEASPSTWNVHTWQTNGDQVIQTYCEMGLIDVSMKTEGEYQWTYEMATAVDDVTASATDEEKAKWNITDGQTGRMWKITLNPDAKWADGTPINADTYIYSMQQMLNPLMKNYRADLYWGGESAVYNGYYYFQQGSKEWVAATNVDTTGLDVYLDFENCAAWSEIFGADLETVKASYANYMTTSDGVNLLDKYKERVLLTDDVKADLLALADLGVTEEDIPYFCAVYYEFPAVDFADVGLYKLSDYEIVYVTTNPQTQYYFYISCGSNWIVYEPLYEAGKKTVENLVTTDYGTSVDTYMSYGPYKLVSFEKDKQFVMVKNENWYGYTDGKHENQYQTTAVKVNVISEHDTILQMFLKGELDNISLTSDDLEEYGASDYLLKTPETYTMRFFFNTNLEVLKTLEAERNDGNNLEIISVEDFRKAISWCFDREKWCKEATAGEIPQVGLLGNLYYYDVENDPKSVYRNSTQAMEGIVNYYGIEYGEGKNYATLEDAYRACTGYDLDKARALFQSAYDEAVAQGVYTEGQKIVINIGAAKGAASAELTKQEKMFNDFLAAGTEGTSLEGLVSVVYVYNLTDRYGDVSTGVRECGYGGLGGAAFYPYRCFNSYIDANQAVGGKISEGNFDAKSISVDITYDFDGDGTAETVTDTLFNWNASIGAGGQYYEADHPLKLTILSKIECTILDACHCFPITVTATVSMYSKKVQYATTNYNIMYSYGGIRLMTYNYTDAEWADYVASQSGKLNYK